MSVSISSHHCVCCLFSVHTLLLSPTDPHHIQQRLHRTFIKQLGHLAEGSSSAASALSVGGGVSGDHTRDGAVSAAAAERGGATEISQRESTPGDDEGDAARQDPASKRRRMGGGEGAEKEEVRWRAEKGTYSRDVTADGLLAESDR